MTRKTLDEQIEQMRAALQKKVAARDKQRKRDTDRKKILIGALYLSRAERDPVAHEKLLAALDGYLTRDDDRKLFGLTPKTKADTPVPDNEEGVSASGGDRRDPLVAAQQMTKTSADHGDPSKVVGRDRQEGPKNGQEGHDLSEDDPEAEKGLWERIRGR